MYDLSKDLTHQAFTSFPGPHILMLTNHGIHQWDVVPGLPDTGGQNLFVNMFTETLASLGFRITIVNRGGYAHPVTKEMQLGLRYKDARQRIIYLEDGRNEFVRKEDMDAQIPQLADFLWDFLEGPAGGYVDMIISHYWDGAKLGAVIQKRLRHKVQHIWVPHSLGTVKKRNMNPDTWADLRIDERIAIEKDLVGELDAVASTSPLIREALVDDYGVKQPLFLPPCINPSRFHPRQIHPEHEIYEFISRHCGLSAHQVRNCKLITEISRTDRTKRKDVLIRAFAKVHARHPDTLLVVSIDENEETLHRELWNLIAELGITSHVAVVGNIWEWLPDLYGITSVYCSPSVMEGFGMAVQEAAATSVPIVGSHLIPFVTEYLLDGSTQEQACEDTTTPLKVGRGAIIVQADDVEGFACAIDTLVTDEDTRVRMGEEAYKITIPYFTWDGMVRQFLEDAKFGEIARTQYTREGRFHLDRSGLLNLLDSERIESLSVAKLEELFRAEQQISKFLPDGVCRVDPRDGALVVFNAARARRPHDNAEPPPTPLEDGSGDPICRGDTTRVVDVAALSEGFTFVNKNLFPAVFPTESFPQTEDDDRPPPRGMHFLQWTSSYFDRDWHNMPQSDRVIAMTRLAALEEKLLTDETSYYPESGKTVDGRKTRGYVLMMKNHGRSVGGSLAHGHQQIVFSNRKPRHFERNEHYAREHSETFAEMMIRENPNELFVKDYGPAVLMVPYFMKRPYNMLLILKDHRKSHLFDCDQPELTALARALGEVTAAFEAIMPSINRPTAYNITISNGPGTGLYFEFLPYTQETGGLEHLGLWICQDNPTQAAKHLRHFVKPTLNGEGGQMGSTISSSSS